MHLFVFSDMERPFLYWLLNGYDLGKIMTLKSAAALVFSVNGRVGHFDVMLMKWYDFLRG